MGQSKGNQVVHKNEFDVIAWVGIRKRYIQLGYKKLELVTLFSC